MVAVIAVFGPTASGKTAVAEEVADRLGSEVVSCDAMQVYRGLPILTNQPSRPTALVGIRELSEEMSVGAYATLAHAAIDELVAGRRRRSSAAAPGSTSAPRSPTSTCRRRPAKACGSAFSPRSSSDPAAAHERLAGLDPRAAEAVHANDQRRLVRALELAETGASLVPDDDRLWASATRHPTLIVGLEVPPDELERRIVARTEAMFAQGVVAEVRGCARDAACRGRQRRRSASTRSRRCPRTRPASASSSAPVATPRISGSGCAGSRGSCRSTAREPSTRSQRQCSGLPQPSA